MTGLFFFLHFLLLIFQVPDTFLDVLCPYVQSIIHKNLQWNIVKSMNIQSKGAGIGLLFSYLHVINTLWWMSYIVWDCICSLINYSHNGMKMRNMSMKKTITQLLNRISDQIRLRIIYISNTGNSIRLSMLLFFQQNIVYCCSKFK